MVMMIYCVILLHFVVGLVSGQREARVRVSEGTLVGREEPIQGTFIYGFKGIPYAEPPVGSGRFRPPLVLGGWTGEKMAVRMGPPCPQPGQELADEDCLHLSVWTRSLSSSSLKPVIIYLTGNLFTTDIATKLEPQLLVAVRDIVVVTVSYRLNVFGFLSMEDEILPGNVGLLDQYLAILWIRRNIDRFGGDKTRVTLGGSGAGAASALYQHLSPRSENFFHQLFLMSGSPLASWAFQSHPQQNAQRFSRRVGCTSSSSISLLRCLQEKPVRELIRALESHLADGNITNIFSPVNDQFLQPQNQFLGANPRDLLTSKRSRTSYLLGVNTEDGLAILHFLKRTLERLTPRDVQYFVENSALPSTLRTSNQIIQQVAAFKYFPNFQESSNRNIDRQTLYSQIIRFYTDAFYVSPMFETAKLLEAQEGTEIHYLTNSYKGPDLYGNIMNQSVSGQGQELLYMFGLDFFQHMTQAAMNRGDRQFSARIQDIITSFVLTGRPPAYLSWPMYGKENSYLDVSTLTIGRSYRKQETDFWLSLLPRLTDLVPTGSPFPSPSPTQSSSNTSSSLYSTMTWLLLAIVLLLLLLLAITWLVGRRRSNVSTVFTAGSASCIESIGPVSGSGPRPGRWRQSVIDYRL